MESKESAITSKSNKKAELKQRIFSTFNSSHIPSIDTSVKKELNEPKITKKYYEVRCEFYESSRTFTIPFSLAVNGGCRKILKFFPNLYLKND